MSSNLLSLPPELISAITALLSCKDLRKFFSISSFARQLVLPYLFYSVEFQGKKNIEKACEELNSAGDEIKHVIRRVGVAVGIDPVPLFVPLCVFRFLETLPNLSIITFNALTAQIRLQDLCLFVTIARKTALRDLSFALQCESVAGGRPIAGPDGMESISIDWNVRDGPDEPGSSMGHLYEFLRPSLSTLRHLKLQDCDPGIELDNPQFLDFRSLEPACISLRELKYTTFSGTTNVLEAVAGMFPSLTHLQMVFDAYRRRDRAAWMDDFLHSLSLFPHLTHLTLGLDFERAANDSLRRDHDFAWYRRCFFRRYHASEKIAKVYPMLQRCTWVQLGKDSEGNGQEHDFVIREEAGSRVVKPVMQWWMTDQWKSRHGGPLPDNMVKENMWWERSYNAGDEN